MPTNLIIFLLVLGFFSIITILVMVKKKKIMLKHAIFWTFLIILVMISTLITKQLKEVATFIGIEEVSNMIFLGGFLVLLGITLLLTSTVSSQKIVITKLVQEIALTNKRIGETNNVNNKKSNNKI
jgi:Uncharacterized conserved protein (DUF2304).